MYLCVKLHICFNLIFLSAQIIQRVLKLQKRRRVSIKWPLVRNLPFYYDIFYIHLLLYISLYILKYILMYIMIYAHGFTSSLTVCWIKRPNGNKYVFMIYSMNGIFFLSFRSPDKLDEILAAAQQTISTSDSQGHRGHGGKKERNKGLNANEVTSRFHLSLYWLTVIRQFWGSYF